MKNRLKKLFKNPIFNIALILVLSLIVMWFTMKDNGDDIVDMIKKSNKTILIAMFLLMIFERIVDGWGIAKQCQVTNKYYSTKQGFVNAYTASLFNNITPSASGGQFAQLFIFRRQGMSVTSAVSVLWLNFIIYQTTMSIFVLVLLLWKFTYFYTKYSNLFFIVVLGFIVNSAVIFMLWALIKFPRIYRWITTKGLAIGHKLHLVKDPVKTKDGIDRQLNQFDQEVRILNDNKRMIFFVALSHLVRLVIIYSVPFLAACALQFEVTPSMYFDTLALASFVAMVNAFVPSPGSSGGTEATFVLMFSTIFGTVKASTMMILWRVVTYYFQTIVGAIVYGYARSRPVIIYDNIQEIPDKTEEIE